MSIYDNIEERIRDIGERIYSASKSEIPSAFDKSRWIGKALDWAMQDEDFKVRLFRFIDVLPSLRNDELVVNVLKEYFSNDEEAHGIMKWGIKGLPAKGFIPSLAGKAIRENVEAFARQFIAGRDPEDALPSLEDLRQKGFAFGIDILGEVVLSEKEVGKYVTRYSDFLSTLHPVTSDWPGNDVIDSDDQGPLPVLNISLKISSLYSQLDPVDWHNSIEKAKENVRPIFQKAKELGASITVDMEHYYIKDITVALFKSILEEEEFRDLPSAGIALQAYLRDCHQDLTGLIEWAKDRGRRITVRLVKGAYWDYEIAVNRQRGWPVPVFLSKGDTDHTFEELTKFLLENSAHVSPAIATHNTRSISHTVAAAELLGLPKEAYEFQMLYGMAEPLRKAVHSMGHRVRIYTPVGELVPGMSYLVRRLLENTSNESFLRKSFAEGVSFDDLIRAPEKSGNSGEEEKSKGFSNEPPLDFSKEVNREKMTIALDRSKKKYGSKYPLYIGGKELWKEEETVSFNPANPEEIVGTVSIATRDDADRAVEAARTAFHTWKGTAPAERADYLFNAADAIRKRRFELAALEVYEVGKSWKEADGDVVEAIDYLEFYGREMIRIGNPSRLGNFPGEVNEYSYEPRGVGVVIAPWNFPLAIAAGMVSGGIVTGNCIIFKPSGLSPVTGWMLMDIFRNAGLPDGVLQLLNGPGSEVGEHLLAHRDIDFITFTGSRDVGLRIIETAGRTLPGQRNVKKVVAEMGGKNAIIIDETADVDDAVKGVLESALGYQGQKCSACSRAIVVGDMYEEFTERLREAMASIHTGPPENPSNFMGPLIDKNTFNKSVKYIEEGKESGKELLSGEINDNGYFVGPSIFADVHPDSPLAQEEIFSPVLSIMKAKDIDEALDIANNTLYALTGGIFSRSPSNINTVRENLRVGNLYINRQITGAIVGRQPFGGFGMSGVGSKAGGPDYLLQFMNPKSITENTMRKGFSPHHE